MPASFAALEDSVNAAVGVHLSNRLVTAGALSFVAIFEAPGTADLESMVASTEPRLTAVPAVAGAALLRGQEVSITHPVTGEVVTTALARDPEPDGGGTFTLYLREGPITP